MYTQKKTKIESKMGLKTIKMKQRKKWKKSRQRVNQLQTTYRFKISLETDLKTDLKIVSKEDR